MLLKNRETQYITFNHPLLLESGLELSEITLAYQCYGTLNKEKSNAILVLHALSGDAHVAGVCPKTGKVGWWDEMVGPNKPFDTNQFFIICSNVIGSCYGSTGPESLNPETNKPYGLDFPTITIKDMVEAQKKLIDYLEIETLFAVAGGSMGGMQALKWSLLYPKRVKSAIVIAATSKTSPQNIAFHEIGRQSILSDPYFNHGNYYLQSKKPNTGLALARMVAHITYLSDEAMEIKFGRDLTHGKYLFDLKNNLMEFQVQNYLRYQGQKFVERFDANSYLYITKAMDYFDVTLQLQNLKTRTRFLVVAFTSDWLFPVKQSLDMIDALRTHRNHVSFTLIDAKEGHDSFLVNLKDQQEIIEAFLQGVKK